MKDKKATAVTALITSKHGLTKGYCLSVIEVEAEHHADWDQQIVDMAPMGTYHK
jgi:hypothetical protein